MPRAFEFFRRGGSPGLVYSGASDADAIGIHLVNTAWTVVYLPFEFFAPGEGRGGRVADSRTHRPPMPMPSAFRPSTQSGRLWTGSRFNISWSGGDPPVFSII